MSVIIRILKGEGEGKPRDLILEKGTILIGRGEDQDVRLTNDSVSRRHCVIEKVEDQWCIQDESSKNSVLVNGLKVGERKTLKHGDVLELGEVICRVGLDRPLKEDSRPLWALPLKVLVNLIAGAMAVVVVLGAVLAGWILWQYKTSARMRTEPLAIALGKKLNLDVFTGADRTQIAMALPEELSGATGAVLKIGRAMPEWDLRDIWSTVSRGQNPRLFDGMDLELAGGRQYVAASYFFHRETFIVPDVADPYGYIYFELEGWSGFGPRVGAREVPAIRQAELPHYVRTIDLWPQNVQEREDAGYHGRELASFWGQTLFEPRNGHPLGMSATARMLTRYFGPPPAVYIPYEGRYYSFFYNGCRYAAVVRGSAHLLSRFKGGVDKLAETYFDGINLTPQGAALDTSSTASAELETRTRDQIEILKVFAQKQYLTSGAGSLRYTDLNKARQLLLELQRLGQASPSEGELRTLYFQLRDRAQRELELCANNIYEGHGTSKSEKGAKSLQAIRDFLGDYNTISMTRDDPRFPEWNWYIEEVSTRSPYNKQRL